LQSENVEDDIDIVEVTVQTGDPKEPSIDNEEHDQDEEEQTQPIKKPQVCCIEITGLRQILQWFLWDTCMKTGRFTLTTIFLQWMWFSTLNSFAMWFLRAPIIDIILKNIN